MTARVTRTAIASPIGLKRLEEKRRLSGKTAEIIADLAGVSRSSAQKFFKGKPISVENFQSLCSVLEVDWREVVESEEALASATSRKRVAFVIEGSLDNLDPTKIAKLQAIVRTLQQLTGDASMTTVDIEEGSIRLILEGSEEGLDRLQELFEKGQLAQVLGTPVKAIEPIEPSLLSEKDAGKDHLKALLVSKIRAHGAWKTNLRGADLRGANLRNANLNCADLRGADLFGADLRGANLSNVNPRNANQLFPASLLIRAGQRGANLCDANLRDANLHGADLSRASLCRANLSDANLSDTNLKGTNFKNATLENANLQNSNMERANLESANLNGAYLINVDLSHANLKRANLTNVNLNGASLVDAVIDRNTNIEDKWRLVWKIVNRGGDSGDFSNANLSGAYLSSINFSNANFSGANLSSANLSDTNLILANLSGANLSSAYLIGAYLNEANFTDANVQNALFGEGIGLAYAERQDLARRGAIFNDNLGKHRFAYSPVRKF